MDNAVYTEKTEPQARQKRPPEGVQGWGADLDPQSRPAVPRERTPPRLDNVHWDAPAAQQRRSEVLHSTERPGITPVFGSTLPPAGLSGVLRRAAFRFSENDLRHWLVLLLADRVDVGEGLLRDLAHGHIPNLWKEMGGPAEWRYNRAGLVRKAVIAAALVGAAVYLMRRRRD